jgi:hypothetical protein
MVMRIQQSAAPCQKKIVQQNLVFLAVSQDFLYFQFVISHQYINKSRTFQWLVNYTPSLPLKRSF